MGLALLPLLVPGTADGAAPLLGATTRVSVDALGGHADGPSGDGALSSDGLLVAFSSERTDIGPLGEVEVGGVFVRDRARFRTTRVSVSSGEVRANGYAIGPDLSANGRFVAFVSNATNLVPGDTNGQDDVFVRDLAAGTTRRVSVRSDGAQALHGPSGVASLSSDGRYVVFASDAPGLVAQDQDQVSDVFVHDSLVGTTTRLSTALAGGSADGPSVLPRISDDGTRVVFTSDATDLVAGDTNAHADVFVRDRTGGTTTRVSVSSSEAQASDGSYLGRISGNGRRVVFSSWASDLVSGDTGGGLDVFVRDLQDGTTVRASVTSTGGQANSYSEASDIDGTGRVVAFTSWAYNLVPGGALEHETYVRDLAAPASPFADFTLDGLSDVLARDTRTGELGLYRGTGTGLVTPARVGASGWNGMSEIVRGRDVDRDGREDVLARQTSTGQLWMYPGRHAGFAARRLVGAGGWGAFRELVVPGDLDHDGWVDLLAVRRTTGDLVLYPGDATGFGTPTVVGHGGWNGMSELTGIGDLTGDGYVDLVAREDRTDELWLYRGRSGGLGPRTRVGTGWGGMRDLVAVGDLDRDGWLDLVAVRRQDHRAYVYLGRGMSFPYHAAIAGSWSALVAPLL